MKMGRLFRGSLNYFLIESRFRNDCAAQAVFFEAVDALMLRYYILTKMSEML